MARPGVVRADTIDLQSQNSPSAQDHTRKNTSAAPIAPHQTAELRHVQEERNSEEVQLSNAWNNPNGLSDEPPSDDDVMRDDQQGQQNGNRNQDTDMHDGEGDDGMDDDMMDKISSSPSISDEDIDFEFVYALHTFVATVEGQANAQKGDTMVLLDDSNSYWWLVRVVKDSTIGYLPAEHIETPTERLARLNKHRNVDLSQTMLGDTTEKTKNPLKKAMRRRNAKQVTFTQPTYIEPSEYEYTTDESDDDDADSLTNGSNGQVEQERAQATNGERDEISAVEPLNVKNKKRDTSPERNGAPNEDDSDRRRKIDESRASDEQMDREFNSQKQSRHGTPRNTDSFFRDESIETRKITLTPSIARDANGESVSSSGKSSMEQRGPSLDLLEKDPKPAKGSKKEKKPGMLSGLFKRKEKKSKEDSVAEKGKLSGETLRHSPSSEEASPVERSSTADTLVSRTSSKGKLQKSPPSGSPPTGTLSPATVAQKNTSSDSVQNAGGSAQSTPRSASPADKPQSLEKTSSLRAKATESVSGISSRLRSNSSAIKEDPEDGPQPLKIKRAKTREALDVESSPEDESRDPFADAEVPEQSKLAPTGPQKLGAMSSTERLSDSPVHISKADAMPENEPPALGDFSSNSSADELASLRSSPSPPMTNNAETERRGMGQPAVAPLFAGKSQPPPPTRSPPPQPANAAVASQDRGQNQVDKQRSLSPLRNNSTSTTNTLSPASSPASPPQPAWNDSYLRQYMDTTEDIRDLLVVVNDTRGVMPVGMDHPLMSNLFVEERGKLEELDAGLDRLLGQWLGRKRGGQGVNGANGVNGVGVMRKGSTPTPGSKLRGEVS